MFGYKIFNDSSIYDLTTHNNNHVERRCNMFRYVIYLFNAESNSIKCREFICRTFEVNFNSLIIYPTDYSEPINIYLDSNMRFEVIPYRHLLQIS